MSGFGWWLGGGRHRYDGMQDVRNFPLIDWAHEGLKAGETVSYHTAMDAFVLLDARGEVVLLIDTVSLQSIVGLGRILRTGRLEERTPEAAERYFRHERFLRSLQPESPPPPRGDPARYDDNEDE